MDEQNAACCAHLTVKWTTKQNDDGSTRGWWACKDCGAHFSPNTVLQHQRGTEGAEVKIHCGCHDWAEGADHPANDENCIVGELMEALKGSDSLIVKAQEILATYIVPDSGISDHDCINSLLGLLDGPEQRLVQAATHAVISKED